MSEITWKGFRHVPPPLPSLPYMPVIPPFTEADVAREAVVLARLAEQTALGDPWTAASNLFGGAR